MLVFSPFLRLSFTQATGSYISSIFSISIYHCTCQSSPTLMASPLTFCSARFDAIYNSVMLYHWFIVGRLQGLYPDPSPSWRPRKESLCKLPPTSTKWKTPPAPNYLGLRIILLVFMFIVCVHVHAAFHENPPINSLCATPMLVICSSSMLSLHQHTKNRAIYNLLTSSMNNSSSEVPIISTSFHDTTCFLLQARYVERMANYQRMVFHHYGLCSWKQSNMHRYRCFNLH